MDFALLRLSEVIRMGEGDESWECSVCVAAGCGWIRDPCSIIEQKRGSLRRWLINLPSNSSTKDQDETRV